MYPVSIWLRLVNFIGDALFIRFVLLRLIVIPALQQFATSFLINNRNHPYFLSYLIYAVVLFIYYFVAEASTGMTVGKILTQTKVVTQDGRRPTTRIFLFRTLWRLVPFEAFSWLGYAGWHDTHTGTTVVRIGEEQQQQEEQPADATE
ncbi:MAG: RDD family protein [Bacteroidetes bacterium]|nr:RDD family protein [Bacteroidota bacterium]